MNKTSKLDQEFRMLEQNLNSNDASNFEQEMREILREYNIKLKEIKRKNSQDSIGPESESSRNGTPNSSTLRKQITDVYLQKLYRKMDKIQPGFSSGNARNIKKLLKYVDEDVDKIIPKVLEQSQISRERSPEDDVRESSSQRQLIMKILEESQHKLKDKDFWTRQAQSIDGLPDPAQTEDGKHQEAVENFLKKRFDHKSYQEYMDKSDDIDEKRKYPTSVKNMKRMRRLFTISNKSEAFIKAAS